MIIIYSEIIDGKEYRYVELRGRGKLIASDGSAINPIRRGQKATMHLNHDGYPCFGGGAPVHLYVAHAWIDGWFEGAEVNHKDLDRTNFDASNLEWVTHRENIDYTLENNYDVVCKSKQGEKNGRSKFNAEQVYEVRKMYDDGCSINDIAKHFAAVLNDEYQKIRPLVALIIKRETWKCLPER